MLSLSQMDARGTRGRAIKGNFGIIPLTHPPTKRRLGGHGVHSLARSQQKKTNKKNSCLEGALRDVLVVNGWIEAVS